MVFGGTSGAGPHAAGVLALLAQSGIRGRAAHDAIRDGASTDGLTVPNEDYGHGRLDAAGALGVAIEGEGPTIALSSSPAAAGEAVRVVATVTDPDGGSLEVRWDDGYDGTWDGDFGAALEHESVQTEAGLRVKARVRDPQGHIAEAAILVALTPSAPDAGIADGGVSDGGARDAGGASDDDDGCGCAASSSASVLAFVFAFVVLASRRSARVR
jgi:hypothetical protein